MKDQTVTKNKVYAFFISQDCVFLNVWKAPYLGYAKIPDICGKIFTNESLGFRKQWTEVANFKASKDN